MELRRAKGNGKSKFFVQVLLKDNEPDQPMNLRKVTIAGKIKRKILLFISEQLNIVLNIIYEF